MSYIKQPLESVIFILHIATKVGVCSCLEQITDKMRIKFPEQPLEIYEENNTPRKMLYKKAFLSFILIIATIKLTSVSMFVNSRPI